MPLPEENKKFFVISKQDLAAESKVELEKLGCENVVSKFNANLFCLDDQKGILNVLLHMQTICDFAFFIDEKKEVNLLLNEGFNFSLKGKMEGVFEDLKTVSVGTLIKNVKGNENRINISAKLLPKIKDCLKKELGLESKVDHRNPDLQFIVYCINDKNSEGYNPDLEGGFLLGIRLHRKELEKRDYRVFAHKAGFKGDMSAFFLRELLLRNANGGVSVDVGPEEKFLVMLGRDGSFAIEAALMLFNKNVREVEKECLEKVGFLEGINFDFKKIDLVENSSEKKEGDFEKIITFSSESAQNLRAAKNNAAIAKVSQFMNMQKILLDEYAFSFHENSFSKIIARITSKDEKNINEIFYQLSQILKPFGKVMLITKPSFEICSSDRFEIIRTELVKRGKGEHKYYLLEKRK